MMQIIPLKPIPNQRVVVQLGGQNAQVNVYQKSTGMFLDLYVNNALVVGGVICENLNRIVRNVYLGFQGDLGFWDTQGSLDPYYTGLGARYQLLYLTPAELVELGIPTEGS